MLPEWQSSGPAFEDNANVQDYIAKRSDTSGSNNLMNSNFNYNQFKQEESNEVRSGYIKSIELIDFMCHRHLTIELHEKINFLTGNNGSGKSAILTALSLCLGGRARSTQRATSAENLIREGANLAKIRISLSNKGANPYPSVRGPVIIIERKILRTGSSEYRIFDSQKQNLGARKEDVNAICDHFGIQIDNPLVILTQETAKRFLASSKPSDLYEFFMKSTQLEQLQFDYIFSQNRLADAKLSLERSVQRLEPLSENIAKLERKLAEIEQLRMAEVKIKLLRQELVWAHVTKKEKVCFA